MKREAKIQGLGRVKFKVLEKDLEVGGFINHEEVTDIKELRLAAEFPYHSDDSEYRYYEYHTTFNQEPDEDPEDKYYCIYTGIETEEELTEEDIEEIIDDVVDFLIVTEAGLTEDRAKMYRKYISSHANDYIKNKYEGLSEDIYEKLIEKTVASIADYFEED